MSNTLTSFAAELAAGTIRVVDLTQTLSEDFPPLVLPPQFGQVAAFKMERISKYDEAGPGWYWNNFSCGEHTGTHFDAPIHWVSGKDHENHATDTLPMERFVAPAVVVDATEEVKNNPDYLLTLDFLKAWEAEMDASDYDMQVR